MSVYFVYFFFLFFFTLENWLLIEAYIKWCADGRKMYKNFEENMLKIIFNVIVSFCITSQSPKRLSSDFLIRFFDMLLHSCVLMCMCVGILCTQKLKCFIFSVFIFFFLYFIFISLALPCLLLYLMVLFVNMKVNKIDEHHKFIRFEIFFQFDIWPFENRSELFEN